MNDFIRRPSGLLVPMGYSAEEGRFKIGGKFRCQLFRNGRLIDDFFSKNLVVNQGLNDILNAYFNAGAQSTAWYMGIFQGNYTPVPTDTAATIATNSTECSSYTNATRPQWIPAAPSGQSITNSANRATFTFNATVTIYGAFLINNNTIAGTAGTLFAGAQFSASKGVVSGDQLLMTYTVNSSSV